MNQNGHSKLSPSKSSTWTDCTASVAFIEAHPELPKDTSKYADEGTAAHLVLTKRLTTDPNYPAPNAEMDGIIGKLVKFIHETMGEVNGTLSVDQKVQLFYKPDDYGTLDILILGIDRIIVMDLKYGVGVGVYAEKNTQLAIYAESKIRMLEECNPYWSREILQRKTPIDLIIYQPRDRNDPEPVRTWTVTRQELFDFSLNILMAATTILSGGPVRFSPGSACTFCRAAGICTAKALQGLQPVNEDNEPVDLVLRKTPSMPAPESLTREQRQRILKSKKDMISWLEAVENQEVAELLNGAAPMDFKLVEGKTNRQWVDEKATAKLLVEHLTIDQIFKYVPPEIVSPAQAEKLLKGVTLSNTFKAEFSALHKKPTGKPTMVPISDPRPALLINPSDGLSSLEEDPRDMI